MNEKVGKPKRVKSCCKCGKLKYLPSLALIESEDFPSTNLVSWKCENLIHEHLLCENCIKPFVTDE